MKWYNFYSIFRLRTATKQCKLWTAVTSYNIDELHKHNIEWKEQGTKEYIVGFCEVQKRQNWDIS